VGPRAKDMGMRVDRAISMPMHLRPNLSPEWGHRGQGDHYISGRWAGVLCIIMSVLAQTDTSGYVCVGPLGNALSADGPSAPALHPTLFISTMF
jgi:hypothetical protein